MKLALPIAGLATIAVIAAAFLGSSTNFALSQSGEGQPAPPEFKRAGVCARCHVVSVLEWGLSGHVAAEQTCQECHGASLEHVADERNQVAPDHLPRGAEQVTQLCSKCHETGCPESLEVQDCQRCHHMHALINPANPPAVENDRLGELLARWEQFGKRMDDGDQQVSQQNWKAARTAYRAALKLIPGQHRATTRLEMCDRRLNPKLPGFTITSDSFDEETGLPQTVDVDELKTPMLLVPGGEFDMGSDALVDSAPLHTVRVDAFYLGRYEVTQAEWQAIMNDNPSTHQDASFPEAPRMPVEHVSWNECQEFVRRLNARIAGGGFRLPSEAEWEYACRSSELASGGASEDPDAAHNLERRAWFRGNSLRMPATDDAFVEIDAYAPRPVGTRAPNAWGFYDMLGNVSEWCSSLHRPYLYHASDGRESLTEEGMRVVRGGSFASSAAALDPALRHAERPHRKLRWNGLRLARSIPRLPKPASESKQQ